MIANIKIYGIEIVEHPVALITEGYKILRSNELIVSVFY